MDVAVYPTHLTYRVIGGILDLSFFGGPGPEQVVRQYQQVIGAAIVCVSGLCLSHYFSVCTCFGSVNNA